MGSAASKPRKLYRPFDGGEFTVAWLTYKGDAIEDEEHRYVVKKSDLLSSKLFRALFGEITMKCFEEIPGDVVSKEALICILALSYEGNTEDRISYVFSMYNIVYSGERANEGCISEKDYLLLLEYLEAFETLPKELSAVFEECKLPMAGILTFSQFVQWVRLYPLVMDFLARLLPPSPVYVSPALVRANDEFLNPSDPLNNSPSCRQDNAKTSNYSSFDFIGGEDSGDDSDELYDSDQISEMEDFGTSLHESSASEGRDDTTTSAKDSDTTGFDDERSVKRDDGAPSPPLSQNDPFYPPTSESTRRTKGSRSRNVQKMGRHIGKAVGGGISKVGHVGRSILHVGKSQGSSSSSQGQAEADSTVHTAGYSFSSETQTTKNFVCGYLHKVGDGKWSKRSWHRRWFVLDRQRGVLSYYRHNPAKHIPSSQHGNIVRMEDSPAAQVATLDSKEDEMAPPSESERMSEPNYNDNRDSEFDDPTVSSTGPTDTNSDPEQPQHQQQQHPQQQQHHQLQHQNVLYLNKSHPWYRGAVDLNQDNASLFFEKSLAKNAPTSYFFQVSTLSLREIESKRGVQYKLCADNDADFDVWTLAIAEAINRKHLVNGSVDAAPVLSHQQLYHQGLLQEKLQSGKGSASNLSMDAVSPPTDASSNPQPTTKPIPPPIVTNFTPSMSMRSDWNLEITVEGKKQCMILGFMVNIVAIQLLAGESVLWRFFICIAVTATYIMTIYNPRHDRRQVVGYGSSDATADISQCSDPQNCCLHKTTVSRTNDPSANGYGTDQRSRAPSAGSLAARTSGGHLRKFKMGSSMAQTTSLESGNSSGTAHAWSTTRAETFSVRGPEYKKLRRKQPSAPALFEFVAADIVRTDSKVELISQLVEFPPEVAKEKLFIINAQLPSYGPSVWGDGMSDGPGFSLVLYWKIPEAIHEELKDPKTTTLRLLKRFIEAGNDTSLTDRFKVIAQVTNQDECGLSGMAKKLLVSHNATPVLTRPQHRIYHLPDGSTEIDVDIHTFSYIARRGIHLLLDKTTRLVIDIAFVLQGETEDELPEQVLGCCRLDRADVQQAMALP